MRRLLGWVPFVMLLALPETLTAQGAAGKLASIRGIVVDDKNNPIARATLSVDNAGAVQADAAGRFTISNLAAGRHVIVARAVGFQAVNQAILLKSGETLDVEIELARIALDTNRVVGLSAARTEFDDRRARKLGFAIDSSILNNRADMLSALSRIPLTTVRQNSGFGVSVTVRMLGSRRRCAPAAFLDGIPTNISAVTALPPDHFRAIEVLPYETVPAKYMTSPCAGAILFWSKNVKW